jgi:beta-barrel assembly-enhancing protease
MRHQISRKGLVAVIMCLFAVSAYANRTQLKPGFNLFSPQQDVEMGKQVSQEAEQQLPIFNNRQAESYLNSLGRRLASRAPGEKYPYQFKIVNDKNINAFALPGGYIYINRGIFERADNEAQLAGVIAHEIGHVAMRHGTNQASKAYMAQAPLAVLGGVLGSNSVGGVLAQLGVGFATNSILLKYSRDAERQADLLGTQILYDSGYDPHAMVEFFEKIQAESKGSASEFFSSHPNPENRISGVQTEIEKLGGNIRNTGTSSEFQRVKSLVANAPAPPAGKAASGAAAPNGDARTGRPERPSSRSVQANFGDVSLRHPDNWRGYGEGSAMTIAPNGGIISNSLAYGMMVSIFEPEQDRATLEQATNQLLDEMRRSNPNMRTVRSTERIRVGNQRALSMELSNDSPAGGKETDWLVTLLGPNGELYYFIGVAPQNEFRNYQNAFEDIMDSVTFR